jgi:cytochrome c oxidase subunit 4
VEETAATATEEVPESSGTPGAPAELEAAPGHEGPAVHDEHAHPSPAKYVMIAMILAAVTGLEVGLYYIDMPDKLLVAMLLGLAFIKFGMVVAYFMHLKFDGRLLRRLFVTGLLLALSVYTIALLTLDVLLG